MRFRTLTAVWIFCVLAGGMPAHAAGPLDGLRSASRTVHAEVTALREKQAARRSELNEVSANVASLKAKRRRGLPAGTELNGALQRTQELATELARMARDLSDAESRMERADRALVDGLGTELAVTQQRFEASPRRPERQALLGTLRALRAERDQTRQSLPHPEIPELGADTGSEDPTDLLEQADALRDSEDKARDRLKLLDTRLAELRQERDLDRRMNEFVGDDQLFDEQTRRLRVTRNPDGTFSAASSAVNLPATADAETRGPPLSPAGPGFSGSDNVGSTARASDHPTPSGPIVTGRGGSSDERALQTERDRLKKLADELEARARALETRAKSFR